MPRQIQWGFLHRVVGQIHEGGFLHRVVGHGTQPTSRCRHGRTRAGGARSTPRRTSKHARPPPAWPGSKTKRRQVGPCVKGELEGTEDVHRARSPNTRGRSVAIGVERMRTSISIERAHGKSMHSNEGDVARARAALGILRWTAARHDGPRQGRGPASPRLAQWRCFRHATSLVGKLHVRRSTVQFCNETCTSRPINLERSKTCERDRSDRKASTSREGLVLCVRSKG